MLQKFYQLANKEDKLKVVSFIQQMKAKSPEQQSKLKAVTAHLMQNKETLTQADLLCLCYEASGCIYMAPAM
jgi:hypothetical protein